ncbi:MAG TPA: CheR family methyltransferase [Acetobacteraceae bacterium]
MAAELRVVGIGASAGGVEALRAFFANTPGNPGVAFLVVLHLLPGHASRLPEIIGRETSLPVAQARDGEAIEANHVYVIPPDALLCVGDGNVRVQVPTGPMHEARPIDFLFSSMAAQLGARAIGVVLSGSGTDGALGLKAIRQAGGFALAQGSNGSRPQHGEMPAAAIATAAVDLILPVEQMAECILRLPLEQEQEPDEATLPPSEEGRIAELKPVICALLRGQVGHDFSGYKQLTFVRRVHRRMTFLGLDPAAYVDRMRADPHEVTLLFHDLLIGVTAFFRDPDIFEAIRHSVVPLLFAGKSAESTVRIWVPGCSTGEEAYSLAILLREHMASLAQPPHVQIFATDLDEAAITLARAGRYPAALLKDVSAERLARFFTAADGGFVVSKAIRELCTFSVHSVIRDPPFSRMDMVSCRNLLIYLDAELQSRVLRTFHYALQPGGVLWLGGSETITRHSDLFVVMDRNNRIFQRHDAIGLPVLVYDVAPSDNTRSLPPRRRETPAAATDVAQRANARVLEHFAPAFVVVSADGEVLHFSNRTGRYLEPAEGTPSHDVVAIARRGLRPELRAALRRAADSGQPVLRERIQVEIDGGIQEINLTVEPLVQREADRLYLVVFAEVSAPQPRTEAVPPIPQDLTVDQIERELREAREQLQATLEEHETALEELKSSNEELHSVNEELQSTNEELETSKEEIQSMNEELQTVNTQLTVKVDELDRVNSDLRNLFESTQVATVFLDRFMVIRNFTPAVSGIYNLIPGDIGRPLTDIVSQLDYATLEADFRGVLQALQPLERRVARRDLSTHYLMRVAPYRTADNKVDGALLTFVDISSVVQAEQYNRLLVDELNQRVNSVLALVMALAERTLREVSTLEAFADKYLRRVGVLASACTLLARDNWARVPLRDVVMQELMLPGMMRQDRVTLEGPEVPMAPRSALATGIVMHELARHAVATGLLSALDGRVSVRWHIEDGAAGRILVCHWVETGTPEGGPPFDMLLVELCLEQELKGTATLVRAADGMRLALTMPLRVLSAGPDEPRPAAT